MPNWNEVLAEIQTASAVSAIDKTRRKYLGELSQYTGRHIIAYYSGWLSRANYHSSLSINDEDKNAFMATIHKMDRSKGLDLILHTPGGSLAAVESLVDYLHKMFDRNIRAIVPQIAMSAGTMMACATQCILMGKESNLGPIDPQLNGLPANGVLQEFKQAIRAVKEDPGSIPIWQAIIGKYHPSFLGECERSVQWSKEIVEQWLTQVMFKSERQAKQKAHKVVNALSDTNSTLNHSRHLPIDYCIKTGLEIQPLEEDNKLQDLVLTVHHTFMHTFSLVPNVSKIVENDFGVAMVRIVQ